MELLADRDPEEARKLLDPVIEHMMEAVHRYEGTVNKMMGDGIMALFGAPLAHEDHAVRACYAALRMQESVRRYAEESQTRRGSFDSYSCRFEFRRGGDALDRQRSSDGLFRDRPNGSPRFSDGTDGDAGNDYAGRRQPALGRRLCAGQADRPGERERNASTRRSL